MLGIVGLAAATAAVIDASRRLSERLWPGQVAEAALGTALFSVVAVFISVRALVLLGWLGPGHLLVTAAVIWITTYYFCEPHEWEPPARVRLAAASVFAFVAVAGAILLIAPVHPLFGSEAQSTSSTASLAAWITTFADGGRPLALAMLPGTALLAFAAASLPSEATTKHRWIPGAALVVAVALVSIGPLALAGANQVLAAGATAAMAATVARGWRRPGRDVVLAGGLTGGVALGCAAATAVAVLPLTGLLVFEEARRVSRVRSLAKSTAALVALMLVGGCYLYLVR